jgi:hypothetical protein
MPSVKAKKKVFRKNIFKKYRQKKTARTSQKEEEVGELPRAT